MVIQSEYLVNLDNDIDKLYLKSRSHLIYQVVLWDKTNEVEQQTKCITMPAFILSEILLCKLITTICFVPKQRFDKLNAYVTNKLTMSLSNY